ncbi:MAG: diguanylate cyclase [Pseudomonadota bacterium]
MSDDIFTAPDAFLYQEWESGEVDWALAVASIKATLNDTSARRDTRLAETRSQVQGLIHAARDRKLGVLLGVLNRIDQEIERETERASADLSRLNRLIRYLERLARHLEVAPSGDSEALALCTGNRRLPDVLKDSLLRNGYHIRRIDPAHPDAALLDRADLLIHLAEDDGETLSDLSAVTALRRRLPGCAQTLMLSHRDDFAVRAAAVRAGFDHLVTYPIDSARLNTLLNGTRATECDDEPITVLLIDDMTTAGIYWRKAFARSSIRLLFESDPEKAFDTALSEGPDVILLDLYMPEMDGVDLARIFREHPQLTDVPILFMSSEDRDRYRFEAKLQGGDDFLNKSISSDDLIRMVRYRAQRYRQARAERITDSLTGLMNHRAIKGLVESELERATRQEQPLSVAMVDIDHFKQINDTWGHPSGDRIIRGLSTLLNTRLRKYDGVGRYGGEEFMIVLPATAPEDAVHLIDRLRVFFADQSFETEDGQSISCHFSAGVASYPAFITTQELINAADEALYTAKQAGRNRVELRSAGE